MRTYTYRLGAYRINLSVRILGIYIRKGPHWSFCRIREMTKYLSTLGYPHC